MAEEIVERFFARDPEERGIYSQFKESTVWTNPFKILIIYRLSLRQNFDT
jgi:hypothetical protein